MKVQLKIKSSSIFDWRATVTHLANRWATNDMMVLPGASTSTSTGSSSSSCSCGVLLGKRDMKPRS